MWEELAYIHLHEPWQHCVQDFTLKAFVFLNDQDGGWVAAPKENVHRVLSAMDSTQDLVVQKDHEWRCITIVMKISHFFSNQKKGIQRLALRGKALRGKLYDFEFWKGEKRFHALIDQICYLIAQCIP